MDIYNPMAGVTIPTFGPTGQPVGTTTTGANAAGGQTTVTQVTDFAGVPGRGEYKTVATAKIIDGICEGPIYGWPTTDPYAHIYVDGVPISDLKGNLNLTNIDMEYRVGTLNQTPLTHYTALGAAKTPIWTSEIVSVDWKAVPGKPVLQPIQIRDDSTGSYPPVEAIAFTFSFPEGQWYTHSDGDLGSCTAGIKIEINNKGDGTGEWVTRVNDVTKLKVQNAFEKTYVIKLPPGWLNPKDKQGYSTNKKVDDIILFRISKTEGGQNTRYRSTMYLKNYTIYSYNRFTYPYTAVVGLTIDSSNFDGRVPRRQYELMLKKVKVPSNYNITLDNKGNVVRRQYAGVWDGTFKEAWTDNPAWCFYDLVSNKIYGLGKYINEALLNKWTLYSIGRYCDAVDSNGVFDVNAKTGGVPNGYGGIEPRYTCNLYLNTQAEAYDRIMQMASIFKGIVFFQNNAIHTLIDKQSDIVALFTNADVSEGAFSYSTSGIKARHTVAKVKWYDPNDFYIEKVEYVEDTDGIRRFGYREIEIEAFGCTSRGQARRAGRHTIITEKFESEVVSFITGIKGAILSPGLLIKIKDSFRQQARAGGRIKSRLSNTQIELDKEVTIPAGATNIKLWVESPDAIIEQNVIVGTLKPTIANFNVTATAGTTTDTLTITSGTLPAGVGHSKNWILSYTPAGDRENTSVYKIVSVVERSPYEYEVQGLEHHTDKYAEIEALIPIKQLPAPSFSSIYPEPPRNGNVSFDIRIYKDEPVADITISWSGAADATKYTVLHSTDGISWATLASNIAYTSYVWNGAPLGLRYFQVLSSSSTGRMSYQGLILGPYDIKMAPPVVPSVPIPPLGDGQPEELGPGKQEPAAPTIEVYDSKVDMGLPKPEERKLEYEVWRNTTGELRELLLEDALVIGTSQENSLIKVEGLGELLAGASTTETEYRIEQEYVSYPHFRITTGSNDNTVVIVSLSRPDFRLGNILFNSTRNSTSIIVAVDVHKSISYYTTTITLANDIVGQEEGDIIYSYAGIAGVSALSNLPEAEGYESSLINMEGIVCAAGTDNTTIVFVFPEETDETNYPVYGLDDNDYVYNVHRKATVKITSVSSVVSGGYITYTIVVPNIDGQVEGNIIYSPAFKNSKARVYRYEAAEATSENRIELYKLKTSAELPSLNDIVVNYTRKKASLVDGIYPNGATPIIDVFPPITDQEEGDDVFIIPAGSMFKSKGINKLQPTVYKALAGSDSVNAKATGAFAGVAAGDLVYCIEIQKYAVVYSVTDDDNVVLRTPGIPGFTTGSAFFVQKCSEMVLSESEGVYNHPDIYNAAGGTNEYFLYIDVDGEIDNTYISRYAIGDKLFNATTGTVREVIGLNYETGQGLPYFWGIEFEEEDYAAQEGDYIFFIKNSPSSLVTPTSIRAIDGAFLNARAGDVVHNLTRGKTSRVLEVTKSGIDDPTYDEILLEKPISGQSIGDQFILIQGYYSWKPTAFYADDTVRLEDISGVIPGTRVSVYRMYATLAGKTAVDVFSDAGLEAGGLYWYWVRAVDYIRGYLVSDWLLRARGKDSAPIPQPERTCYEPPYIGKDTTPSYEMYRGELRLSFDTKNTESIVFDTKDLFINSEEAYVWARRYIFYWYYYDPEAESWASYDGGYVGPGGSFSAINSGGYEYYDNLNSNLGYTWEGEFYREGEVVFDTKWVYPSPGYWETQDIEDVWDILGISKPTATYVEDFLNSKESISLSKTHLPWDSEEYYPSLRVVELVILTNEEAEEHAELCVTRMPAIPETDEEGSTVIGTKPPGTETIVERAHRGFPYDNLVKFEVEEGGGGGE